MRPFGKYQLIRRLAAGGMAEVFLATGPNPRNAELVAVKLILQAFAEDEAFMKMFLTEARLAAPLHHPNLVEIFDLGMAEDQLYLAMEYIPGRPLSQVRKRSLELLRQPGAGEEARVTPLLAAGMVRQAAAGLHQVHEARSPSGESLGLVHRDISPQNLMLSQDGLVKVVDFGVAKATAVADVSRTGSLKGKVGYIAPEQLKDGTVDRQVDVFALGAVLFELATGVPLFNGRNEAEILRQSLLGPAPDLSQYPMVEPALGRIILRAVERDRARRYPTARLMEEDLSAYLGQRAGNADLARLMSRLFDRFPTTPKEASAQSGPVSKPSFVIRADDPPADEQTINARKPRESSGKPPARVLPSTRPYPLSGEALITDPTSSLADDEATASVSMSVTRRDPRQVQAIKRATAVAGVIAAMSIAGLVAHYLASPRQAAPVTPAPGPRAPLRPPARSAPSSVPAPSTAPSDTLELDDGKSANAPPPEIRLADLRDDARKAMASGDYGKAMTRLRKALHENPNDPASHLLMGKCLAEAGNLSEAAAHYQKFVDLARHDPQAPEIMRILDSYSKKSGKP